MRRRDPRPDTHATGPAGERLRQATDTGRTGDKIPYEDPAAAPLGTDDEAAGQSPVAAPEPAAQPAPPAGHRKGHEHGRGGMIGLATAVAVGILVIGLVIGALTS